MTSRYRGPDKNKKFQIFCVLHLFLILIVLPPPAFSNQKDPTSANSPIKFPEREPSWIDNLIEKNKKISNWFDKKVEEIDLFLVGKTVSREKNLSNMKVINTTESIEGENFKNNTTISINPKLANLEKFLKIRLSTYVERDEYLRGKRDLRDEDDERALEENPTESDDFWHDISTFHTSFEPRIELTDPLKVSHSLNFGSHGEYGSFSLDPRFEFFADYTKGVGIHHALNFAFRLNERFSLRFMNEAEYQHRIHLYNVENGMTLNQSVGDSHSLGYGFVVSSTNQPNFQMYSYRVFTSWNWTLYRRVLDLQVVPQIEFPKTRDYRGIGGCVVNLIVNF